jgi:hypothetical protein
MDGLSRVESPSGVQRHAGITQRPVHADAIEGDLGGVIGVGAQHLRESRKRVGIGPLRADLVPTYGEWEKDPGAIIGYGRQVPHSLENRTEGYGHQVRGALNQVRFTVYNP